MSDRRTTASLGSVSTTLSLAVQLVDRYTGRLPRGDPKVRVEEREVDPVRNPSGYHVFLDLDPGPVTVVVDGGQQYVDERITGVQAIDPTDPATSVDPSDPDTLPLERIALAPAPPYRFPATATLVRGTVVDPAGNRLPGATVSVANTDRNTRTDANGEFVLFFDPVTGEDVTAGDDGPVVQVNDAPPVVTVTHPDQGTTSETLEDSDGDSLVREGALTVHDVEYR